MRLMKRIWIVISAAILAAACGRGPAEQTPAVLEGEIEGEFSQLVVLTYRPGEITNYLYPDAGDGKFDVVMNDVDGFMDLAVAVDDDVFGARVIPGDTLRLRIFPAETEGRFDVEYDGPTEKESRIWTDFYDVYGYYGQYNIRPDKDPDMTYEDSMSKIGLKDLAFRTKYGDDIDDYYLHYADLMCGLFKAVLLEERAGQEGVDAFDYPEYQELLKDVDPNDPFTINCGLLNRWARFQMRDLGEDDYSRCMAFMDRMDNEVTYTNSRNMMADLFASLIFRNPADLDEEHCHSFLDRLGAFAPDAEEMIESTRKAWDAYKAMGMGAAMPDAVLTTMKGDSIQLSSLYGKILYIDFWATWCGPCVKETPYLADLVSRLRDNDAISIISISLDDTEEPWLEKLNSDSQMITWPQYHLDTDQAKDFLSKLNLNSIPRFVIVDRDGTILDADAMRPSYDGIDDILLEAANR